MLDQMSEEQRADMLVACSEDERNQYLSSLSPQVKHESSQPFGWGFVALTPPCQERSKTQRLLVKSKEKEERKKAERHQYEQKVHILPLEFHSSVTRHS